MNDEQAVVAKLKALITKLQQLDGKRVLPKPKVLLFDGGCLSSGNSFLNYTKNTGVGLLHSIDHYNYNDYDLIDKDCADRLIAEKIDSVQDHPALLPNLSVEFITSSSTYNVSQTETLHIYTIGGGGGFVFNSSNKAECGLGRIGELGYLQYNATAGESFTITVGEGGDNQTDSTTATDGTATTLTNANITVSGSGGAKGTLGIVSYEPRHTRHWFNGNYGFVHYGDYNTWHGSNEAGASAYLSEYHTHIKANTHHYSGVLLPCGYLPNNTELVGYPKYGLCGVSFSDSNGAVSEGLPAQDGCVIIIRENIC